ncbi:aldehyde dehydrogenase family protein [Haladaptatus sp. CMSO5]|uniref:aldehyde dehydrogenase family protein n=1 Tax=Haladaptatus sp. CMSO5 TaxID=3120514 RepID=UPI002FCDFFD7
MPTEMLTTLTGRSISLEIEPRMYVDGAFVEGNETFRTVHPPTETKLADVPIATKVQVDAAVAAANRASDEWMALSQDERRRRVEAFADICEEHETQITNLDVADNGSSISRLSRDASSGANSIRYYAGLAPELKGETIPTDDDTLDFTRHEPYGAVAAILPFNHPVLFCLQLIATAVVAGNGIVIKPSEYTSLSSLYVARLVDESDLFPPGLINIVTGGGAVGARMTEHPDVGMVTFIGSAETGSKVMQGAATHIAPVMLGTGGKNPVIVFPDVDPEEAAEGAVGAMALAWQGQSCGSGSRLLVHEDVYDEVVSRVVAGFEDATVGDPFDEDVTMGSIVSEQQYEQVLEFIDIAKDEGATLLTGGKPVDEYETGYFIEPTVFEVTPDMTIAREEIFGPVLSVMKWSDYGDVIDLANSTRYGLSASVWTNDLDTALTTVEDLEAGYVWVNQHGPHFAGAPFGGFKQSGIGKKDSIKLLRDHTQVKNVAISLRDRDPLA